MDLEQSWRGEEGERKAWSQGPFVYLCYGNGTSEDWEVCNWPGQKLGKKDTEISRPSPLSQKGHCLLGHQGLQSFLQGHGCLGTQLPSDKMPRVAEA